MHYFAIGDIHGMYDAFDTMMYKVEDYISDHDIKEATFVTLGDYIDRGPCSKAVVQRLIDMQHYLDGSESFRLVTLRGNHEQMYLDALSGGFSDRHLFHVNGGSATLASYGVQSVTDVPFAHKQFFRDTKMFFETADHYFVHAGVRPGVPLDKQHDNDRLWIREEFLNYNYDFGKQIVHGHTPKMYDRAVNVDYRTNLDFGAVFGGNLVCAVFTDGQRLPIDVLAIATPSRKG